MSDDDSVPKNALKTSIPDHLRVVVRPLPKAVFFYPTWIVSVVGAVVSLLAEPGATMGTIWMTVFLINLLAVSFDFTEERTLIGVLGIAVVVLLLLYFGWWAAFADKVTSLRPSMDGTFYGILGMAFTLIFGLVWVQTRFDYWEFRPNEVLHRSGVFPKVRRFSTDSIRWEKNIPDLLERLLLGAGQIVLTTPQEPFPIIIEHVARIGSVDDRIAHILGVKAVVHTEEQR